MITSNPEHKKAKLKTLIRLGSVVLTISILSSVISVVAYIYSKYGKEYRENYYDDLYKYTHELEGKGKDMLDVELDKKIVFNSYLEEIAKRNSNYSASETLETKYLVYDASKTDQDIIAISDSYKDEILSSLYNDNIITLEEKNNKRDITVGDLKKVRNLYHVNPIDIYINSDISWLNYCTNINTLEIRFSDEKSLDVLQQIKSLNISRLILTDSFNYYGNGITIDETYFSFLKNCPNIRTITMDSSIFSINSEYLKQLSEARNGLNIVLESFGPTAQKIDINTFESFQSIQIKMADGTGIYDIPISFSREEFNQIMNNPKVSIWLENGGMLRSGEGAITKEDYIKEVNLVYDQIDKIVASLKIKENMNDKEKLKIITKYILDSLVYNETSAKLQSEQGVGNVFGTLSEDLKEESKNSYTDGFLYGVFNENGKPICGNYAALAKVLLNREGVEAHISNSRYHAYNLVNVDGEYYYVDLTFLDNNEIDLDRILENDIHLIPPGVPNKIYDTSIVPQGVELPEFTEETAKKRVDQILESVKKEYVVKFNNQVFVISFSSLMSLLAGLGLAISKKKYDELEMDDTIKLMNLNAEYEYAKEVYEEASPLKKAILKISGKANFEKMQAEIDTLKGTGRK